MQPVHCLVASEGESGIGSSPLGAPPSLLYNDVLMTGWDAYPQVAAAAGVGSWDIKELHINVV